MNVSEKAQLSSHEVAKLIYLKSKFHVFPEPVILPAYNKIAKIIPGNKAVKLVKFFFQTIQLRE